MSRSVRPRTTGSPSTYRAEVFSFWELPSVLPPIELKSFPMFWMKGET